MIPLPAYGIQSFPTTLLVGRDGTLVQDIDPRTDRAVIEKLIEQR